MKDAKIIGIVKKKRKTVRVVNLSPQSGNPFGNWLSSDSRQLKYLRIHYFIVSFIGLCSKGNINLFIIILLLIQALEIYTNLFVFLSPKKGSKSKNLNLKYRFCSHRQFYINQLIRQIKLPLPVKALATQPFDTYFDAHLFTPSFVLSTLHVTSQRALSKWSCTFEKNVCKPKIIKGKFSVGFIAP